MRATLIHNPTAGDERPTADDLKKIMSDSGFQVRYQSSKKNWKKALQDTADLIVVAGGDGTVAKVFRELAGSELPVAVLPVGTANNIARTLGIVGDAEKNIGEWRKLETRPFDVFVARNGKSDHTFVEAMGGGVFATSISGGARVAKADGLVGHEIDRALAHVRRVLAEAESCTWHVEVDGIDLSGEYLGVEAMNIRHSGPNVPVAPDADPTDGELDVVLIRERDREGLLNYLDQRLAQHEVKLPNLLCRRGRSVELRADSAAMHVDDEALHDDEAEARWRIRAARGAVRVVWPAA